MYYRLITKWALADSYNMYHVCGGCPWFVTATTLRILPLPPPGCQAVLASTYTFQCNMYAGVYS